MNIESKPTAVNSESVLDFIDKEEKIPEQKNSFWFLPTLRGFKFNLKIMLGKEK